MSQLFTHSPTDVQSTNLLSLLPQIVTDRLLFKKLLITIDMFISHTPHILEYIHSNTDTLKDVEPRVGCSHHDTWQMEFLDF